MNNEEKIYTLLEKMYIAINERFEGLEGRFENLEADIAEIKPRLASIENIVVKIENDHGQKLGALLDGYKLNSEKLDRIENEVAIHEEIILRRIR